MDLNLRGLPSSYRTDLLQRLPDPVFRRPHIELILQIQPQLSGRAERLTEPQRGIGRDRGFLIDNSFDARARNATRFRECSGRQAQWN